MAFKKLRGAVKGFIGSVSGDINSLTSGLESKFSKSGNKFDQRIADSLSDLLTGLTGVRTSNIPAISAEVLTMKKASREARAQALKAPDAGRAASTPSYKVALSFPESFDAEDGSKQNLSNYIHFRSLERNVKEKEGEEIYDIFLYIPDTLQDNISVAYKEAEKSIVDGLVGGVFLNEESLGTSGEELMEIIKAGAPGSDIIKQSAGKTVNPLKFQLFDGVNFRTYSYTFNLRPKNAKEANTIQEIIYAFKMSALPGTAGDNERIFTFPNEWAIRFRGPFKDKIDYPLVSVCTGVDVNYAEGQGFATFADGSPMSIGLVLNFTETATLTRSKFKKRSSAFYNHGNDTRESTQEGGSDLITTNDGVVAVAQAKKDAAEKAAAADLAAAKEGPL